MSENISDMALLFDFFGDLLTEKQRECFDLHYNSDLSLSEIAEDAGISRQGVRDNIIRAENSLREFESKTGTVKRFLEIRQNISDIESSLFSLSQRLSGEDKAQAEGILLDLQKLKG